MTANYPSSLPVKDPAGALLSSNPHSALHNKMYEEIAAIAGELGTNVSGPSSTLSDRIGKFELGAWTDYTNSSPLLQNNTAIAVNTASALHFSRYIQFGPLVLWRFNYVISGTGTAGYEQGLVFPVDGTLVMPGFVSGVGWIWSRPAVSPQRVSYEVYQASTGVVGAHIYLGLYQSTTATSVPFYSIGQFGSGGYVSGFIVYMLS